MQRFSAFDDENDLKHHNVCSLSNKVALTATYLSKLEVSLDTKLFVDPF